MHKLGEQWIEIIDGQEHMLKAVDGVLCTGCVYSGMSLFGYDKRYNLHLCSFDGVCPVGAGDRYNLQNPNIIIKDLGILKDGRLPCPFCGEYPIVKRHESHFEDEGVKFYIQHVHYPALLYDTEQQAIDAWNRRY